MMIIVYKEFQMKDSTDYIEVAAESSAEDAQSVQSEIPYSELCVQVRELNEQLRLKDELIQDLQDKTQFAYDPFPVPQIRDPAAITEDLLRKIDTLVDDLRQKDTLLKQLMKSQFDERNKQFEERERTDTIIMKLTRDLEDYRKAALLLESKISVLVDQKYETRGDEFRKYFEHPEQVNRQEKQSKVITLFSNRAEDPEKDLERLRKMMNIDPLDGKNIFQRFFIRIFRPELLRKAN